MSPQNFMIFGTYNLHKATNEMVCCLLQMNIGTLLFHFFVSVKLQFFMIVSF